MRYMLNMNKNIDFCRKITNYATQKTLMPNIFAETC